MVFCVEKHRNAEDWNAEGGRQKAEGGRRKARKAEGGRRIVEHGRCKVESPTHRTVGGEGRGGRERERKGEEGRQRRGTESKGGEGMRRERNGSCLLYTSPSPRDGLLSRMPSSA